MLRDFLYWVVRQIAFAHDWFMSLNNKWEFSLSDKAMHFIVIGLLGMAIFLVVNPIFKFLAKRQKIGIASWFYTVTVIVVITFAIEIGQKITKTGTMDFADIVFGIAGFLALHLAYLIITSIYRLLKKALSKSGKHDKKYAPLLFRK